MKNNLITFLVFCLLFFSCQKKYPLNFNYEEIETIEVYKKENESKKLVEKFNDKKIIKEFIVNYINKSKFEIVKFYSEYEIRLKTKSQVYIILVSKDLIKYDGRSYHTKTSFENFLNEISQSGN